jgi:hypothetical protein
MNSSGNKSMIFGVILAVAGLIFFILAINNSNNSNSSDPIPVETVYSTVPPTIEYIDEEENTDNEEKKSSNQQLRDLESQASEIIAVEIDKNPTFDSFGTGAGEVDLLKNPDVEKDNWEIIKEENKSITYKLIAEQNEGTQAFIILNGEWKKFTISVILTKEGQDDTNYTKTYYKTLTGEYVGD